jgi:hypothetical protein
VAREPLAVFLGDLHAGSKLAPGVAYTDADGGHHFPSLTQNGLRDFLSQALADTKVLAKGCDILFLAGGDLVDGVGHHGSIQTIGTQDEQAGWAVELLSPWADIATWGYGLKGTDAHVGDSGQQDLSVCGRLGFTSQHFWRIEVGGRLLDWAHHAQGSRKPWLTSGGPVALANKTYFEYLERGERLPNVIARHHLHFPVHVMAKGIQVVSVPGWQAQTSFSRKLDANGLLTVGVALWWPLRDTVRLLPYNFPAEGITRINLEQDSKIPEPADY